VYAFVCVGGSVTTITRIACIDPHQTEFVGKGSDHLQLIKFWPSASPETGLWRDKNFWLHLTTASTQCLRLSERFFSFCLHFCCSVYFWHIIRDFVQKS